MPNITLMQLKYAKVVNQSVQHALPLQSAQVTNFYNFIFYLSINILKACVPNLNNFLSAGSCSTTCPDYTYKDTLTWTCKACDPTCK
jgi:hypothetical protein